MEVKCSPELRELIYRPKKSRKTKEKTPASNSESNRKTNPPVKQEVTLMETDESAVPKIVAVSGSSDVSQKPVAVVNSHDAEKPVADIEGKPVAPPGDQSSAVTASDKSTEAEKPGVPVATKVNGPENAAIGAGSLGGGGKTSAVAGTSGGKPASGGNVGANMVEPIVIDD